MKYYIVHRADGSINESLEVEDNQFFNVEQAKIAVPGGDVIEINEEEYKNIKGKQENFKVRDKKVNERTATEKQKVSDEKKKWQENNTIPGLQARIAELEKLIKK